jgi:hypothetical protein
MKMFYTCLYYLFQRYLKIQQESNRDIKWSHDEELELLKGYHIFGDKFHLIELYFLPHRRKKDVKLRYLIFVRGTSTYKFTQL